MKIQKVIYVAVLCIYVQTTNAAHDEEFVDPTDMEHYDQTTKTFQYTLKEKAIFKMLIGLLQRTLESAKKDGLTDNVGDIEKEIKKFLNNEDWDQEKLEIFIEKLRPNKDGGESLWIYLTTLVVVCFTSNALQWIISKRFYAGRPAKTLLQRREHEAREPSVLQTGSTNEAIESGKRWNQTEPDVLQADDDDDNEDGKEDGNEDDDEDDDGNEVALPRSRNNENLKNYEQECVYKQVTQRSPSLDVVESKEETSEITDQTLLHTLVHGNDRQDQADILQKEANGSAKSEIRTEADTLREEGDLYSDGVLPKSDQIENQKNPKDESLSENLCKRCISPNVMEIKDENSLDTSQTLSHSLFNEKEQEQTGPDVQESTDCNQESPPSYSQVCPEEEANDVDNVLHTPRLQEASLSEDEESDFIVIHESAPGSLTFVQEE